MSQHAQAEAYTRPAIALHWLTVLMLLLIAPLGLYMTDLALSPTKLKLYSWHKWLGITLATLTIVRLTWRAMRTPPPLPESVAPAIRRVATVTHILLYLLLLAVPLSGWMMSSAGGFPVVVFGVVPLPDLVPKDKALAQFFKTLHVGLNLTLATLVIVHVAAATKHWLDEDGIFERMVPLHRKPARREE